MLKVFLGTILNAKALYFVNWRSQKNEKKIQISKKIQILTFDFLFILKINRHYS
jgi:hypothetical protein